MGSEWKKERLSDLCSEIADCPHSTPLWTDSGALVLRSQNIRNGRLDLSAKSYTDEAHFEQRSRRARLRGGDLVITREAPMGEVCLIPDNLRCCLGQRMVMLRPDPKRCDSRFLLYSIQSRAVQDEIRVNEGTGSTVSNLRIPLLEALPITHPPLAEQKAIASILGALDDKIELNRRMNATLEGMARALFQSWFVDFDPVRAKLDGRKPEGMDKATAALFPDSFENCIDGDILPKGWIKTSLGEEVQFQTGFSFQSEFFTETPPGIRLARGMNVKEGEFFWSNQARYWPQITSDIEQYLLSVGDILIGMDGSKVGKNWVRVRSADLPCLLVQRVARLREADSIGQNIIALLIGSPRFRDFVESVKTGTSIPHISGGQIKSYSFLRPPHADNRLFRRFESIVAPLTDQADKNHAESENLANLRDTLLPKLLSGELSVAHSTITKGDKL